MRTRIVLIILLCLSQFLIAQQKDYAIDNQFYYHYVYEPPYSPPAPYLPFGQTHIYHRIDMNNDSVYDIIFKRGFVKLAGYRIDPYVSDTAKFRLHMKTTQTPSDTLSSPLILWERGTSINFIYADMFGVRYFDGTDYYYGWIRATDSIAPPYDSFFLKFYEFFFCKIPNYPLIFGQVPASLTENQHSTTYVNISKQKNQIMLNSNKTIKSVAISNVQGVTIYSAGHIFSTQHTASLTSITTGIYIVRVTFDDNSVITKKIAF